MKYRIELSEEEVLAIIFSLVEQEDDYFKGTVPPIRYKQVANKVSDQMESQLLESEGRLSNKN